ncbi:MAG: hypothetical protein IPL03_13410 [Sterolibacteriaceae bacterium]|nr:hypothetical protein [Candidatus Methylophosphatis haderslevensis]
MPTAVIAFVIAIVAALVALNSVATSRVLRCPFSSTGQKAAQLALVWLLPVIGAALAISMTRHHSQPGSGRYAEQREEIDEVAVAEPDYGGTD